MDPLSSSDKMLHCFVSDSECLYRIQRDVDQDNSRVVYVFVKDPAIIPEDARTHGPLLLQHLQEYSEWNQVWTTLTIRYHDAKVRCTRGESPPHQLRQLEYLGNCQFHQVTQLPVLKRLKERVSQVQCGSETRILKIATFANEVPRLRQELKAYSFLVTRRSTLVPRVIGYACEQGRVVGFVCEMVVGHAPSIEDASACQMALNKLHDEGLVHRDINKYNILITSEGPKFIDLENATVCIPGSDDWHNGKDKDIKDLELALDDESGAGQPGEL